MKSIAPESHHLRWVQLANALACKETLAPVDSVQAISFSSARILILAVVADVLPLKNRWEISVGTLTATDVVKPVRPDGEEGITAVRAAPPCPKTTIIPDTRSVAWGKDGWHARRQ